MSTPETDLFAELGIDQPDVTPDPPPADDAPPEQGDAPPADDAAAPAGSQPDPANPPQPQTVPLAELMSERDRRRLAELERQQLADRLAKLEAAEAERQKAAAAAAPASTEIPDYLDDPKAHIDAIKKAAEERLAKLEQETAAEREARQRQEAIAAFNAEVRAREAEFVAKQADYIEALAHVREVRVQQLKMLAPDATDQQIVQQINAEEQNAAMQLIRAGRNPAEVIYGYAKTIGYQPKPATPDPVAQASQADQAAVRAYEKQQRERAAFRTAQGSGTDLTEPDTGDNTLPELDAAFSERFGKARTRR